MALMDIVDDQDNVIGQKDFKEVYKSFDTKKPLLHRGVHVFVINSKNQLLIQKRSDKVSNPYKLESSSSGHVDLGHTYEQSAIKELEEELGIVINKKDLIFVGKIVPDKKTIWSFNVLYMINYEGPFKINHEVESVKFFKLSEIKEDLKKNKSSYTVVFNKMFHLFVDWYDKNKKNMP
ncbi:MAG: NUDIX domain-containing protein [Candidatus Aenigmarchaeota archaeon]|nr:NUDIX domain-containing protein [Candidatus Aenigmarchaeota archaeon]